MHNQVRLGLRRGAQVGDVMPHDHVAQREVRGWAKGQVADNEPHWQGQVSRQRPSAPSQPSWQHPAPSLQSYQVCLDAHGQPAGQ